MINGSSGLLLSDLTLSAAAATPGSGGAEATFNFSLANVSNIALDNLNVQGNPAWGLANAISDCR